MPSLKLPNHEDATIALVLDTINLGKQALVFVNSKRSAEKTAEEIALYLKKANLIDKENTVAYSQFADQVLHELSTPTKQCERLALCLKSGIAFHHAGLTSDQRQLIEKEFRNNRIKIICCTPTLCLSKDTMIWHDMDETEVSNFTNSKKLFALSKNKLISMKAQKVQKLENSLKLIQISSVSGYSIKATPNHKFLIKRNNNKLLMSANEIRKGDKIATIGIIKLNDIHLPTIKDFVLDNDLPVDDLMFDKKLSYLIGAMLGDGYSGAECLSDKIKYKGSPSIVGRDEEIFTLIANVCKDIRINYRRQDSYNGVPQLILSKSKWFREFLCRCGINQFENKHISENLMYLDLTLTASLLKGLFDTDGYVEKLKSVGFSSISEKLIKQMQKLLLRYGIVTRIRSRKASVMKIYGKEYKTRRHFELTISNKRSILDFYRYVGFNLTRKQNDLINLVAKIMSNVNYLQCKKCDYKLYTDLFSGRSKDHNKWGLEKVEVIKLLREKGELGSNEIINILGILPRKKDTRLNHHYELIKKRRVGSRSNTEWYWSLNKIGIWVHDNIIKKDKKIIDLLSYINCPLCNLELEIYVKKGWRDDDFEGDIYWDFVREVYETDIEKEVYDVVLPNLPSNDHMFVANGFITHNSMGIDLPAYRAVLKDLRRFSGFGMTWIPVLEYLQMAGRAGRPKFDNKGEAIAIAKNEAERDELYDRYICGVPEDIQSKLAVEPVLRTYVLSLIATEFVRNKNQLLDFFSRTFWAHQYGDMERLTMIIDKVLTLLEEFEFIKIQSTKDFVSADELEDEKITATLIGKRVAELYIDPLTAYKLIINLQKAAKVQAQSLKNKNTHYSLNEFSYLQMISNTLEMRPLLSVRASEYELIQQEMLKYEPYLLEKLPSMYEDEYDMFLESIKTSLLFLDWVNETQEKDLLEKYNVRPGELYGNIESADWLLYSAEELARLLQFQSLLKDLIKLRIRLKYGAKEELLALLQLKQIGRVRARRLFANRIRDIADLRKTDLSSLSQILGKNIAINIKEQLGENVSAVAENKRKGQINLGDYRE